MLISVFESVNCPLGLFRAVSLNCCDEVSENGCILWFPCLLLLRSRCLREFNRLFPEERQILSLILAERHGQGIADSSDLQENENVNRPDKHLTPGIPESEAK